MKDVTEESQREHGSKAKDVINISSDSPETGEDPDYDSEEARKQEKATQEAKEARRQEAAWERYDRLQEDKERQSRGRNEERVRKGTKDSKERGMTAARRVIQGQRH